MDELTAPYADGRSARANLFANGGSDSDWGPDPSAGTAHALSGIHHSRDKVVRAAAIELPTGGRSVIGVDLTITYDIFTWATQGKPPLVGYCVRLEPGKAEDEFEFDIDLPGHGPTVAPVTSTSMPRKWADSYYLYNPSSSSISESNTATHSVEIYPGDRLRLCAFAVASGGIHDVNDKHSGGGARVIATISKIRLLEPGGAIL